MKQKVLDFFTKLLSRVRQPILPHVHVYKPVHRLVESCGRIPAGPNELEEILFLCTLAAKLKQDSYLVNFFLETPDDGDGFRGGGSLSSRRSSSASKKEDSARSSPNLDMREELIDSKTVNPLPDQSTPISESKTLSNSDFSSPDFALVSSLLSLTESPDAQVSIKACEGLLLVASLPEPDAADALVRRTAFSSVLVKRLVKAYRGLPAELTASELDSLTSDSESTHWGLRWASEDAANKNNPGVKRKLNSFLSLFDYLDQLMAEAQETVAKALANRIKTDFLEDVFEPHLLRSWGQAIDEASAQSSSSPSLPVDSRSGEKYYRHPIFATVLLTRLVSMIRSPPLLKVFVRFILGDPASSSSSSNWPPETLSGDSDFDLPVVRSCLIERCGFEENDETLALLTLRLFSTLLTRPEESIYQNLLLRNLVGRNYLSSDFVAREDNRRGRNASGGVSSEVDSEGVVDDGEDASAFSSSTGRSLLPPNGLDKDLASFIDGLDLVPFGVMEEGEEERSGDSGAELSSSSASDVNEWTSQESVVWFLNLIPESARTSVESVENGYEVYLMDAHHQLSSSLKTFASWNWPMTPQSDRGAGEDGSYAASFFEGSFIRMLLSRMERLISGRQGYELNLQITALISLVATIPHPNLGEFWTNPQLPLRRDAVGGGGGGGEIVTPPVLKRLAKELEEGVAAKFDSVDEFRRAVGSKKARMLAGALDSRGRDEVEAFLEGAILLEEFCKELSSLVLVKDQLLSAKS